MPPSSAAPVTRQGHPPCRTHSSTKAAPPRALGLNPSHVPGTGLYRELHKLPLQAGWLSGTHSDLKTQLHGLRDVPITDHHLHLGALHPAVFSAHPQVLTHPECQLPRAATEAGKGPPVTGHFGGPQGQGDRTAPPYHARPCQPVFLHAAA